MSVARNDTHFQGEARAQGRKEAEQGIAWPQEYFLPGGTKLFRICDSSKPSCGVHGGWWIGQAAFFRLRKWLAETENYRTQGVTRGFRACARDNLAMLDSYGQADVIAMTSLNADTRAWGGTGKRVGAFAWTPGSTGLGEETRTGSDDILQYYIPGLVQLGADEGGRPVARKTALFKQALGSPLVLGTANYLSQLQRNSALS